MKLYRWESPDKIDLTAPSFVNKVDWELLDRLVNDPGEAAASRIAPAERDREFQDLLSHYQDYKSRWKK